MELYGLRGRLIIGLYVVAFFASIYCMSKDSYLGFACAAAAEGTLLVAWILHTQQVAKAGVK